MITERVGLIARMIAGVYVLFMGVSASIGEIINLIGSLGENSSAASIFGILFSVIFFPIGIALIYGSYVLFRGLKDKFSMLIGALFSLEIVLLAYFGGLIYYSENKPPNSNLFLGTIFLYFTLPIVLIILSMVFERKNNSKELAFHPKGAPSNFL